LINVVSTDGKKAVFGRPLSFLHSLPMLNSRSLAMDDHGNICIAFRYFPIVRKYTTEGALIAEYRVESPIMEAKERYNLKAVGEGITDPSQRVAFKPLIIDIEASGDRLYLLSHIPRLEIFELDGTGNLRATYWMDSRDLYIANDLAMLDATGTKTFYVARSNTPVHMIDVLRIKAQASSSLEADIQKWTMEIDTYPDNSLAFVNRGVARHQMGDYGGAISDFSKAIELDPSSALAFNNRGLSRVKLEDFEGAITDLSKAIDLDPSVAAIYFNRGIAYIHGKSFLRAIEDFTMAAKLDESYSVRAQEQIDYCKASLKKK
jgi:tetratricopeptide (TPR) repeat protein